MVMSNRDWVDRGMGYLALGLGPFVNAQMATAFPEGQDWVQSLAVRSPSRDGTRFRYSLSDPRFLLRVITEEWRVFRDSLSRVEQGYATELRDVGNRWAHGELFSAEDTYRTLDTMERLLAAVGAAKQAGHVRALRLGLQQPEAGGAASAKDPRAAQPQQSAPPRRSRHQAGFWSAVGQPDVVRAIEEYDRLGQDRFLAEHGFGRATAYLLLYHGRSYDSKAILGVAYQFATGVPIGAHDFSGGVYGAAGVLRTLGFEIRDTRISAAQRPAASADAGATVTLHAPAAVATHSSQQPAASLNAVDPRRALLVVTCSGRKEPGGRSAGQGDDLAWPADLRDARRRVLATAGADTGHVLPAWRRYTGSFYQHARPALADAVATGQVVIISGGYGIARADEPIGWYDRVLQLGDWPAGLLESALISEARRHGTHTVVAFAPATTDYAKLLRRTRWRQAAIDARLVTVAGITGGAMTEVPRRLGQAFTTFWNQQHASYPPGITVELLL